MKFLALGAVALLVLVAAVGIRGTQTAEAATTVTVQVGQTNGGTTSANRYNPASVSITSGDTVRWVRFAGSHNVVSAVVPAGAATFALPGPGGVMAAGTNYDQLFTVAGTYTYYCDIHATADDATLANVDANLNSQMVGKIVVAAATVADNIAPTVSAVAAAPNPTAGSGAITATATVTDTAPAGATAAVAGAEWSKGGTAAAAGSGTAMTAADGTFNAASEGVTASVPVSEAAGTSFTLWVRGRDAAGNWGAAVSTTVSVTAPPAGAVQASVTVSGGNLSNTAQAISFPGVTLTGADQTVTGTTAAWAASDARGTGAGWNVTVTSSDFTGSGGTIPVVNFKLQLTTVTTISGNTAPIPTPGSFTSLSSATPLKILSAAGGTGMGSYQYTPQTQLTVPGGAQVGTYTANVTVSVNSGP